MVIDFTLNAGPASVFPAAMLKPARLADWLRIRGAAIVLTVAGSLFPALAQAWWNPDFKQRTKITLNTSSAGVETKEALSGVVVPVRLHSGNFDFINAKPDGADLRLVAGDDKTPLKFMVERFDGSAELAVLWVQLPTVAPGSDKNVFYAYAGNAKAAADPAQPLFDAATLAAFHFAERDGLARDHSGQLVSSSPAVMEAGGLIGPSAKLDGTALTFAPNERLRAASGAPYSVSLWIKPAAVAGQFVSQGLFSLGQEGSKPMLRLGALKLSGGDLPLGTWAHVAATWGAGKATLYVNGAQAAQAALPAAAPPVEGPLRIGEGYTGLIDEVQIANVQRSADWLQFNRAAQGADAKLIASVTQTEASTGEGENHGYMAVLVGNLTVDAWVVIGILGVMFVISVYVMISKSVSVVQTDRDNQRFVKSFRDAEDVLQAEAADVHPRSSLARLYASGLVQLNKRHVGHGGKPLSGAALNAVRAAVDADLVRENHHLNSMMVLLTIAIAGGPFLGLLGTVVGVMITFAAIAAAGDVNVNAIAPGIAAALLATVAGLAVAIPALFGYNYLAARIKSISSDMQIFVDEFVTRVAERYAEP
jgi:biopolymer transport protein ExbB